MARTTQIIDTLKQQLKAQGITYRQLGQEMELSESTIKQMFASKNFSLKRLDKICELIDMEVTDLVERLNTGETKIEQLSIENEKLLVNDSALLMVAYCVTNHWTLNEIIENYDISKTDCIRCLAQLDRMQMIELLPENRIRRLISNNFKWQPNGPIEQYFRKTVQDNFFGGSFNSDDSIKMFKIGDLTDKSILQIIDRISSIGDYYDELNQEDRKQPFNQRHGTSMMLAIRKWQFLAFQKLRK